MDIQHDFWQIVATKARLVQEAPLFILASSLIKDEEGQIKWGAVLNGVVTAGMVASVMSLFTMQQTLTELRTKYEVRAAQVELIPTINERQRFILEELNAMRAEKASATSDRFRGSDAQRMEERIQRHIDALDRRIDGLERGKRR